MRSRADRCGVAAARILLLLSFACGWVASGLAQTLNIVIGGCSPIVGTNNGTVNVNCGDSAQTTARMQSLINNHPTIKAYNDQAREWARLQETVRRMGDEIQAVEKRDANQAALRRDVDRLQHELREQKSREDALRIDVFARVHEVSETMLQVLALALNDQQSLTQQRIKEMEAGMNGQLRRVEEAFARDIARLEGDIAQLNVRFRDLEGRVSILEDFRRGRLRDTTGFWAINAGAAVWGDDRAGWVGGEYEWLAPRFLTFADRSSAFVETGYLSWTRERQYATLPGADPQTIKEDHDFWLFGVGARLYLPLPRAGLLPVGISLGHSLTGSERTGYFAVLGGVEYVVLQSMRLALELRWTWLGSITTREVQFNPFGPAQVSDKQSSASVVTIGGRVSWR